MTTWSSPTKSTTTWTTGNKSTKEKAILREQGDILLREQGDYLLQEDDSLDYSGGSKATTSWASPTKN